MRPDPTIVLDAMAKKAMQLGVTGVAVFLVGDIQQGPDLVSYARIVGRLERPAEPEDPKRRPDDTGTNYFGVAYSKVGEMLSTAVNSGHAGRPPRKGEFGWPGGLIHVHEYGSMYFAFSGGTGAQDVEIATAGKEASGLNIN